MILPSDLLPIRVLSPGITTRMKEQDLDAYPNARCLFIIECPSEMPQSDSSVPL